MGASALCVRCVRCGRDGTGALRADVRSAIAAAYALDGSDAGVDPEKEGAVTLAAAYRLKCKVLGEIKRSEFVDGYTAVGYAAPRCRVRLRGCGPVLMRVLFLWRLCCNACCW